MSDPSGALTRFDFDNGPTRGTNITLYASCLVHRSDFHLETLPLAALASVRVAFERDPRWIGWGVALIVVGLLMLAVSGPLAAISGSAAGEVAAGATGVAISLQPGGQTAFVRLFGGEPGVLSLLLLKEVNGTPYFIPLLGSRKSKAAIATTMTVARRGSAGA